MENVASNTNDAEPMWLCKALAIDPNEHEWTLEAEAAAAARKATAVRDAALRGLGAFSARDRRALKQLIPALMRLPVSLDAYPLVEALAQCHPDYAWVDLAELDLARDLLNELDRLDAND